MTKPSRAKQKADESRAIILDLENQLEAGGKARAEKLEQSMAHLKSQLEMAGEKYRTVNGFMQARSTLDQVAFRKDIDDVDSMASGIAEHMSLLASDLAAKLEAISYEDLDETFIDSLLDKDFIATSHSVADVAQELLIVNLLQNVGPAVNDIVEFRTSVDEGIARMQEELAKHQGGEVVSLGAAN